jgi:hypothetical protein
MERKLYEEANIHECDGQWASGYSSNEQRFFILPAPNI